MIPTSCGFIGIRRRNLSVLSSRINPFKHLDGRAEFQWFGSEGKDAHSIVLSALNGTWNVPRTEEIWVYGWRFRATSMA